MSEFRRAERKRVKLKLALTGPSGSGKTLSALLMARGIGQRIAVIDTENGSAELYTDHPLIDFPYDTLEISPPYTVPKYVEAIKKAEAAKFDVLIIDSISHVWAGEGGLLAKKEALDNRGGNSFANWAGITKEHEAFKALLLSSNIHMICTMRSKQEYAQVGDQGKFKVQKLGLAPIQRDGMEYEFTTVLDIGMDHHALPSKDRTGLFDSQPFKIGQETGERLMLWLTGGKKPEMTMTPVPAKSTAPEDQPPKTTGEVRKGAVTDKMLKRLHAIKNANNVPDDVVKQMIANFGVASSKELNWTQYEAVIEEIENWKPGQALATDDGEGGFHL